MVSKSAVPHDFYGAEVNLGAVWLDRQTTDRGMAQLPSNVVGDNRRLGYVLLSGEGWLTEAHIMVWRNRQGHIRSMGKFSGLLDRLYR